VTPSSIYVVQGFDDADFYENETKRKRIKIVVATYSLLQKRSAAARVLQQFEFACVIADESHNLKQKTSQRTQLALPLLQNAKRLLLLSGTPALARPVELWTQGTPKSIASTSHVVFCERKLIVCLILLFIHPTDSSSLCSGSEALWKLHCVHQTILQCEEGEVWLGS